MHYKRATAKPKPTAGFRAKSKVVYILMMSLNLLDLALDKKK